MALTASGLVLLVLKNSIAGMNGNLYTDRKGMECASAQVAEVEGTKINSDLARGDLGTDQTMNIRRKIRDATGSDISVLHLNVERRRKSE